MARELYYIDGARPLPSREGGWALEIGPLRIWEAPAEASSGMATRICVHCRGDHSDVARLDASFAEAVAAVFARATRGRYAQADIEGAWTAAESDADPHSLESAVAIERAIVGAYLARDEAICAQRRDAPDAGGAPDDEPAAEAEPAMTDRWPATAPAARGEPFVALEDDYLELPLVLAEVWRTRGRSLRAPRSQTVQFLDDVAWLSVDVSPDEIARLCERHVRREVPDAARAVLATAVAEDVTRFRGRTLRRAFELALSVYGDVTLDTEQAVVWIRDALASATAIDLDAMTTADLRDTELTVDIVTGALIFEAGPLIRAAWDVRTSCPSPLDALDALVALSRAERDAWARVEQFSKQQEAPYFARLDEAEGLRASISRLREAISALAGPS